MKRPVSHIIFPIACLLMLPFCLQPGSALGVEKQSHVSGKFQMDLGGNDAGLVQPVEGGSAESEVVTGTPGAAQRRNIAPPPAALNRSVNSNVLTPPAQGSRPLCANPPCGLGQQAAQGEKDSLSETAEERQARLQAAQDAQEKKNKAVSNTLKKHSDTQSGIVGNMK